MSDSRGESEIMPGLSAVMKDRILAALDATRYTRQGFIVNYDDEKNPAATISFSSSPEYRFLINTLDNEGFDTNESPGIHLDGAETFRRDNSELCMNALSNWVKRVAEIQSDWILDEFGGVADSNPSYYK
jgi:hypothetical protein